MCLFPGVSSVAGDVSCLIEGGVKVVTHGISLVVMLQDQVCAYVCI